jgi:hypothetical protein
MAYDNDQSEQALPGGNNKRKRESASHLPRFFRTQANKKFLSSTVDQLIQPGVVEKLNGYVGRKTSKAFTASDNYIADVSDERQNYQLEPASVVKDNLGNVVFYKDYNDYINQLNYFQKGINDHSVLNAQEYYAWDPHIDWDKISNFREYYWLPNGPQSFAVPGNTIEVESTYTVRIGDNVDNNTYVFSPDGLTNNPTITLYRGITYRFDIDTPNLPFTIKTKRTLDEGFDLDSSSIIVLEGVDVQGLEKGISTLQLGTDTPDTLYYTASNDLQASGTIVVKDIQDATFLDVEAEIVGKKNYKASSGVDLSNGMKIYFTGEVEPAKYANGSFYVEGVGDAIKLVAETDLSVPTEFTDDVEVEFDTNGFDRLPYGKAIGFPKEKDYIVINRSAQDGNLWSRYNRWFHKSVITTSAEQNNQPVELDQEQRAKRPIIEFEPNIKLHNFGTKSKLDVDLVDNFTKDVFSTIEGSIGYNIDGIDIVKGMRILFTADTDILVKGRIFEVDVIKFANNQATNNQITLKEVTDSIPQENEVVLVLNGDEFKGKMFYYQNGSWSLTQEKTQRNQAPLFDIFDENGISYSDETTYEANNFAGNKVFSYKEGTGSADTELGIPLSYRSINNVGDIVFNYDIQQGSMTYTIDNNLLTQNTDVGFLRKYSSLTDFTTISGWKKVDTYSEQPVIRQYVYDNTTTGFAIDVYDQSGLIEDLWVRVYLNNKLQFENVDFTITSDLNNNAIINFTNTLELNDIVVIKTKTTTLKNENGYYEIPTNYERNPKNDNLGEFTLGEVNDHVSTIVENLDVFEGEYPGVGNLRDITNLSSYGRRFLQHSAPLNLSLYHITDKDANIIKSIDFARTEYNRFKRVFLQIAEQTEFQGSIRDRVDDILRQINIDKNKNQPFYFSDMIGLGASKKTDHIIIDADETFFALDKIFDIDTPSKRSVYVYLNDVQLIYGKDYTFNNDGFAVVTATKNVDDVISIYEYETTNGSYIPPTPTKLGLYPKYEPEIYQDNTYLTPQNVIQGHDGSRFIAFGDYRDELLLELEKRIFNNIKVTYNKDLFDIHKFVPGEYRKTGLDTSEINKSMLSGFIQWTKFIDQDYTLHNFFERTNRFTFNYNQANFASTNKMPGFWRNIYKQLFDTDRPHTHPWEMLGFTIKPKWWEDQYGPAPYTKDNQLMWTDIQNGIVREPNKNYKILNNYKRPGLLNTLPVDSSGNLRPPLDAGVVTNFQADTIDFSFKFGDGAPVESAWRNSSDYPFSLLKSLTINKPSAVFATGFDRINQVRNSAGAIVYKPTNKRLKLSDIVFPSTADDDVQIFTSGLINYVSSYMASDVLKSYTDYKTNIVNIDNQIGFKLGGFTDKEKFRLILDSRTPLNEGNVFVPEENYKIFLNTSSPVQTIEYSGVIIERRADGYVVKGYSPNSTTFKYFDAVGTQNDPSINIGGISESYVTWDTNKTYVAGQNVEYQGSYYRTSVAHTSEQNFDDTKFAKLAALPLIGGRSAFVRKQFNQEIVNEIEYGTLFTEIQDVVDFLLGYGKYLESKGFEFEYFDGEQSVVLNWRHAVNEFLFWTTQKWAEGSVITISPSASEIRFNSQYSMVDNIFDGFYGYGLYKADGQKLNEEFSSLGRSPNQFILRPKNTADGVFYISLPLIQKEHVVLIDNKTVFGDVIFDQQPGYRQERIKVLGYRTTEWDGSLNIPGFTYDDAQVTDWESWTDYDIGTVVKNKEFYYSAPNKISGTETFDASKWNILTEKPEGGLFANFEYKTNQFADFYDLDSDNFDTEQQKHAQHLIGYQKRQYLENIVNDDVSQYKFYQGFIQDKGTKNALTKLFDALASDNKDSLEFFEEWAIKDGQYGASEGFDDVIFKLDESKFRLTPQPIQLVNSVTGNETDLIYRIRPYEVYQKSKNYDHSPFPGKYVFDSYTKNAGYVNQQDVRGIVTNYSNILDFNFVDIAKNSYIWVGNENNNWNVYKHVDTEYTVEKIDKGTDTFKIYLTSNANNLSKGEIIGLHSVYDFVESFEDSTVENVKTTKYDFSSFYEIQDVTNNILTLKTSNPVLEDIPQCLGSLTKFMSVRALNVSEANSIAQNKLSGQDLLWIDNVTENNEWAVYKNSNNFSEQHRIHNTDSGTGFDYGKAIASDDRNTTLLIGAPENADGKVYVYNRPTDKLTYTLTQVLEPFGWGDAGEKFGASVALSPDGQYAIVGSPNASNVKTKYAGDFVDTQNYGKNSIVRKDEQLWRAVVDISGATDNIEFSSFNSVAQTIEQLNLQTNNNYNIPVLLVGNYAIDPNNNQYAFNNIPTSHILIRAPKVQYDGSGINDQIKIAWNTITYANQDLNALEARAPFSGDHSPITDAFLSLEHTIQRKIDAVLYINETIVTPDIGDTVRTGTAQGTVDYIAEDGAETILYIRDLNGSFNSADSLFRIDGDFVGEFIRQAPDDTVDTEGVWGGFWWIDTPQYTPTDQTTNIDKGLGIVYYDVISDSTPTGRYYYNSLDYATTDISSLNIQNSLIRTLTYRGLPGAGGSNSTFLSDLYVMRAPKALTDLISAGDTVSVYVNQLPQYTTGDLKDLTTIGLTTTVTNTSRQVYDVWDGYINFDFTKFDVEGNPFEPRVGDIVEDLTTGAQAEVTFYQRDSLAATIFVKNVTNNFSVGNDYGQNSEIKFLGTPGDPDINYQVDRVMGDIQSVSLGYTPAGIGKLLVFEAPADILLSAEQELIDIEYWMYQEGTVLGIPRLANIPSSVNNEWENVFKIPAESTGTASGLANEGLYNIYSRAAPGRYDPIGSYTVPEKQANFYLGSNVKITKNNDLYRLMVHAKGTETQSNPGRIYFIKTGEENGNTYTWEYAKNKNYKGSFNESVNYFTGDIVYRENPAVTGTGVLYSAKTNLAPGVFNPIDWNVNDSLVDYVGYIPNNTGNSVVNDSTDGSTVLDQQLLSAFGGEFDVNKLGDVIVTTALYDSSKPNLIVVYRLNNGFFERGQQIPAPDTTSGFGHDVAISDDGMYIAVSAPFNDDYKQDQGKVFIYKQTNGVFELFQELRSPNDERAEKFGWRLQYDGNKLHVTSRNADSIKKTSFDGSSLGNDKPQLTFDGSFTEFVEYESDTGVIYVYEKTAQGMLYAQTVQIPDSDVNTFGRNIFAKNNHLYVGLPNKIVDNREGQIIDFSMTNNVSMWTVHRSSNETVDIDKIKKIFLYDTKQNELLTYLDYIDPIQGKVAGPAEQELTYKTYYDPAVYSASRDTRASRDTTSSWGPERVGEVWWNLTNAKFYNAYQGSIEYATNNWNNVFQGNTIDIYEWVESDVVPSVYDTEADTETGFAKGYSGQSLYGDNAYSTRKVYDDVSQSFKTYYYFWVSERTIVPDAEFRNISIKEVREYIEDPLTKGHQFVSLISPEKFVLNNCDGLIKGTDTALNVQFWTIKNQQQNIHNQYQIVSEGLETSQPNPDIVKKWFDSLIGYDAQGRVVPDPNLSEKEKYGTLYRPRQGWFKNKSEALKQFIERVNLKLKENIIVDDKSLSAIDSQQPILTTASGLYDVQIATLNDISTIGTNTLKTAILTPVIVDGKIIEVVISDPGKGYRNAPTVTVAGAGTGAEISTAIDSAGKIISVTIDEPGQNYNQNTTLTVRNFAVLVTNDETLQGKWSLYERQIQDSKWNRIQSQSYNTTLFWEYVDWYATGYNSSTDIDYLIDNSYQLTSLDNPIGSIVKISNIGSGGWLLIEKQFDFDTEDYTQNYKTVGRENGTIQFKNTLYDTAAGYTGFDTISFDTKIFDSEPITELRIILESIRDDLLIDELLVEFNKLFFAGLRYVFSEQTYVDWAFKTSFIKAKHNVGKLREDITFNNDNLPSYESYVKEVKPFTTKIREYLSSYEGLDGTQTVTTDFDLPPSYNTIEGKILPQNVKVKDNILIGTNSDLETYPNKNWLENSSYSVISVKPVDQGEGYRLPPELTVVGGGGSGTVLKSYLGAKGNVVKVDVLVKGSGYYSAPTIEVNGNLLDTGRHATFSVQLGDNPVRGITTTMKFDRTTGTYVYTSIDKTETFTASGSQFQFDLKWPVDLKITDVSVTKNNLEQLSNEYTFYNVLDEDAEYERYYGRIEFDTKPNINDVIVVTYKISPDLFQAQDRINQLYSPGLGQPGKELGQLMSGIDYGGVEVKSFGFTQGQGWDSDNWFESTWDSYDNTYEDEIFEFDGSTTVIELNKALESGVEYHVYKNNVRLDDPNYDGSTVTSNPNAIMRSLIGDGVTKTMYLDDFKVQTYDESGNNTGVVIQVTDGDVLVIRKSTSDGTFLPNEQTYDSILQGGNLNYSTATGLASGDIRIDGDGFVTPTTSAGPEEQVPGQILDTVDIQVYEKPKGGSSTFTSMVYETDGSTLRYKIGTTPIANENVFVKIDANIVTDYTIDYSTSEIVFASAPNANSMLNIVTMDVSGNKILDIDNITADGSTVRFITSVRYASNLQSIVTLNGEPVNNAFAESEESDGIAGNVVIRFGTPPTPGSVIRYVIFEANEDVKNYSEVNIQNIVADGSTTTYNLSTTPGVAEPASYKTIVKVGNNILNAGYTKRYITTSTKLEYEVDDFQFPPGTLTKNKIRLYLNGKELDESLYNLVVSTTTIIRLRTNVQQQDGDKLDFYVLDDGEYRFGYFEQATGIFVSTPNQIHFDNTYAEDTNITIYHFTNHDWQDIQRLEFDVVDRITLTPGTEQYIRYLQIQNGLIALNSPAVDAQYLWVTINGELLIPSVNYYVTDNKRYVKIISEISQNDVVQVIHFAGSTTKNRFGWSQFKDMMNKTHYKRITDSDNVTLAKDLHEYDQTITVINGQNLPSPPAGSRQPAVIFIEGERIEYFVRNDDVISQFRRGTLGTGVKSVYPADTKVFDSGPENQMPYKDETLTTIFTADGTSTTYELDFTPNSVNDFEVFVAGKRLRKNSISSYKFNDGPIALDSPEGDETLAPEFTISSNNLVLLNAPILNTKIIVVRKQGKIWTDPGTALVDSDSDIAKFLRAATVDLPR